MRAMTETPFLDLFMVINLTHFLGLVQVMCIDPIDHISSSRTSIQQFLYIYLLPMTLGFGSWLINFTQPVLQPHESTFKLLKHNVSSKYFFFLLNDLSNSLSFW